MCIYYIWYLYAVPLCQLDFVVLYEKVFVKLEVTVMQVPRAIKGGSMCTAALDVINCVSGLQVFHGGSGG